MRIVQLVLRSTLVVTCLLTTGIVATACEEPAPAEPTPDPDPDPEPDPDPDPDPDPEPGLRLELHLVVDGLTAPVHVAAPAGDPRLFVVEQSGRIRIVSGGTLLPTPFLDLGGEASFGGERGLFSMAFHPDYLSNGRFFVNYTNADGDTRVVRFEVGADPNVADPGSATVILAVDQPFSNHNGGHLLFGPDGMLYIPLGDGGSAGDPQGNGQDPSTLLGSVLRIDVDAGAPYAIPPDNPFVGQAGLRPETWLWGVRNPWRVAFDEAGGGSLYVADVGQGAWEEVTVVGPEAGGANLGWNETEGTRCFQGTACTPEDFTLPQLEYDHGEGCSITGGDVYRGSVAELRGVYFYSDFCGGWIRSFRFAGAAATERTEWDVASVGNVRSFGEDGAGEMYVAAGNAVYRIEAAP